jgi:hypothetical protein
MVPRLFEVLFLLCLVVPPAAVVLGIATLFVPTRRKHVATPEHHMPAAA